MKKLIVLALLAGAVLLGTGHQAWAGTCTWNAYGGSCTGYGPGNNCTWNQYGGSCY
jgi:hypothetical protein